MTEKEIIVASEIFNLHRLLSGKYYVDYFQREYVWQERQIVELINDLTTEFLRNWKLGDNLQATRNYRPYYMGEIILSGSVPDGVMSIVDGQQRLTSFTLLLMFLIKRFGHLTSFPKSILEGLIYGDDYGNKAFNINIPERIDCMESLYNKGEYQVRDSEPESVKNIVNIYSKLGEIWDESINDENAVAFVYWLKDKVCFSRVWANSDDFAYVIFETMNDRGMSLTQVEMLRSYLLTNISDTNNKRSNYMKKFDSVVTLLREINLASKSKAEFEFFKILLRTHFANDLSQGNTTSDFVRIGKEFHRWVRDNNVGILKLKSSDDYCKFIDEIEYFAKVYRHIYDILGSKKYKEYLYLFINSAYGFTLQPALLLAAIKYGDDDVTVDEKIKFVSKYISKILSYRIWCGNVISQSKLEAPIYETAKKIRNLSIEKMRVIFEEDNTIVPKLDIPTLLNQQNKPKIRVLLGLITAIVGEQSGEFEYVLDDKSIEVEHIWADKFEEHKVDCNNDKEIFSTRRNTIGDLLLLPKQFNASYGAKPYEDKGTHYIKMNILAKSLREEQYDSSPQFLKFVNESRLKFKHYEHFDSEAINERTQLYKAILEWNFNR